MQKRQFVLIYYKYFTYVEKRVCISGVRFAHKCLLNYKTPPFKRAGLYGWDGYILENTKCPG